MLKLLTIVLVSYLSFGCGTFSDSDSSKGRKPERTSDLNRFDQTPNAPVKGEFNGNPWEYMDGRAYSQMYKGKEMLYIRLVPFKLVNRTNSNWLTECYYGTPENAGDHFEISLRVLSIVGETQQGGAGGFGNGVLTNVNEEEDSGAIIGHLGEGSVEIEELLPTKGKGFVRGNLNIRYQDEDSPNAKGNASGTFKVLYCGHI